MKKLLTTAAMFAALATTAGAWSFPAHQQTGYRDTGCDAAAQIAVTSDRTGEILYYMNSTCPAGSGPTDAPAAVAVAAVVPEVEPEPEAPTRPTRPGRPRR
jgi:hypothetical protein